MNTTGPLTTFCDMQRSRLQEIVFRQIEEIHRFEYCDDIAYILHNATDQDRHA